LKTQSSAVDAVEAEEAMGFCRGMTERHRGLVFRRSIPSIQCNMIWELQQDDTLAGWIGLDRLRFVADSSTSTPYFSMLENPAASYRE